MLQGILRLTLSILLMGSSGAYAAELNGFELEGALVSTKEILKGGPPRDGIPAIDEPKFESIAEANWLKDEDMVIGLEINGEARAYPILILNWHEIVNDEVGNTPAVITFCPLCGTGVVFATPDNAKADFGVSGLLYNSDVLLYDRQSESLWSQILSKAVTGPKRGEQLKILPSLHTTWQRWRQGHPNTLVLSRLTGHVRDYSRTPYGDYDTSKAVYFPLNNKYQGPIHPKQRVIGIVASGQSRAYPFSELKAYGAISFMDSFAGEDIMVYWDELGHTAWIEDDAGERREAIVGFWFAWYAFHPDTEIFLAEAQN